jgi:predicted nucleotidyltransferase
MADVPITAMKAVAERLDGLGLDYAFLGGSVVGLLLDHPELSPVRATDDVDVVIEVVSQARYAGIEQKLRALKFDHDVRPGAPRCRWVLGNLIVDIMPVDGDFLGLNTAWFREALTSATLRAVPGGTLRVVSPVGFIATKYVAFLDRGAGDYYASHDLEDLITVIDGRGKIVEEVAAADPALCAYVTKAMSALVSSEDFMEALPGHLPPDAASQGRLAGLRRKLIGIAASG